MIVTYPTRYGGLQSDDHNLVYFPINKNAHTWAEKFFKQNFSMDKEIIKTTENADTILQNKINIVILRDPLLRWLSGITQYLIDSTTIELLDNSIFQQALKDVVCFDNHTGLQIVQLLGIDTEHTVFFNCDKQLEENMYEFSRIWFEKESVSVGQHQVLAQNPNKVIIYNKIKNIVRNDSLLIKRIRDFYAPDYNLFSMVRFFNKQSINYYKNMKEIYDKEH